MKNEKYSLSDFRHLTKSLIKFFKMSQETALYYVSCWFRLHEQTLTPPNSTLPTVNISSELLMSGRPYHTEIQLYRSLESLRQTFVGAEVNRYDEPLIQQINKLVHEIRDAFFAKYRLEIDDPETVYSICREHLVPDSSEPMQIMYRLHYPGAGCWLHRHSSCAEWLTLPAGKSLAIEAECTGRQSNPGCNG